jgi:hypothetical protein
MKRKNALLYSAHIYSKNAHGTGSLMWSNKPFNYEVKNNRRSKRDARTVIEKKGDNKRANTETTK